MLLCVCVCVCVSALTKRLIHREVGSHHEHWCAYNLRFFKDVATPPVQDTVYPTNCHLGTLRGVCGVVCVCVRVLVHSSITNTLNMHKYTYSTIQVVERTL